MSDINSQRTGSPANFDDQEERKRFLAGGFDSDEDDDASTNKDGDSTAGTNPAPQRGTPSNRGKLNRFAARRNQTPVQQPNEVGNMVPVPNEKVPPVTNQMAGGISKPSASKFQVEGTNIGSKAAEPAWTQEELQAISNANGFRMSTTTVAETRRSEPDRDGKYLVIGANDSVITRAAAILPNIKPNEYQLGLGKVKPDEKTGKSKLYTDVVMKAEGWRLTQWTSKNVVLEVVPNNILDKTPRMVNGRPERRIGHDFARIGLPKLCFAPVFKTLENGMPSLLNNISQTQGYYWLNASWGVTNSPGNFVYKDESGNRANTHVLREAMNHMRGLSAIGTATIAISVGNESKIMGGKAVPDPGKYELSIKIHNFFVAKLVPYHSPAQASATGFEIDDEMFADAESLTAPSGMGSTYESTASAFSGGMLNPFFGANAGMTNTAIPGVGQEQLL